MKYLILFLLITSCVYAQSIEDKYRVFENYVSTVDPSQKVELNDRYISDPKESQECMLDIYRTEMYTSALKQAIRDTGAKTVLYVGCGSFAPFFTLVAEEFPNIKYTIVEINPYALERAKTVIKEIGLGNQVDEFILGDGVEIQLKKEYDIVISEIMDVGLSQEAQVLVHVNLKEQSPNALFIPENVFVSVDDVFTYDLNTLTDNYTGQDTYKITDLNLDSDLETLVQTTIHLYDDYYLRANECHLTKDIRLLLKKRYTEIYYNYKAPIGMMFK